MKLVIDTNIVIAMLIKFGKTAEVFFNKNIELYAPELLFEEIQNNIIIIKKKSKTNIDQIIEILKRKILVINEEEFLKDKNLAEKICPDEKDVIFFALSLHLKIPLWSNEKKLKDQNVIKVYSTHELIEIIA